MGEADNRNHPFHIHGHSVHVLKIGYGEYSSDDGFLTGSSRDLTCTDDGDDLETLDNICCRFRSSNTTLSLDKFTVRKDTFIVLSGGYVVVQFRSDNPGYWLSHFHEDIHMREEMALVIREAVDKIMEPPDEMDTCSSFIWDVHDFMSAIEGGIHCTSHDDK